MMIFVTCYSAFAYGQQLVFSLYSADRQDKASTGVVAIDDVALQLHEDNALGLQMQVTLMGALLPQRERLVITPRLVAAADSVDFPAVEFFGRWAYYHILRNGVSDDAKALHLRDRDARTPQAYAKSIAFQPWMREAQLKFIVTRLNGCDDIILYLSHFTDPKGWPLSEDTPTTPAPETTYSNFRTFRPLFAMKTNLLFDAVLAPNIELEVPFGRDKRWSMMAEVWCPWWRFDHNPAGEVNPYYRSDQRPTKTAYELLTVGVEARYWFAPRCAKSRPALTGAFVGLYGAGGKYDLGRKGEGDQGEFTSLGLSVGYSWPIARHWNLELSAAAGYVGGPKVHYQNEFDDARLIYRRHSDHWYYIGPTKAKVSLVWVIGKAKNEK